MRPLGRSWEQGGGTGWRTGDSGWWTGRTGSPEAVAGRSRCSPACPPWGGVTVTATWSTDHLGVRAWCRVGKSGGGGAGLSGFTPLTASASSALSESARAPGADLRSSPLPAAQRLTRSTVARQTVRQVMRASTATARPVSRDPRLVVTALSAGRQGGGRGAQVPELWQWAWNSPTSPSVVRKPGRQE